MPLMLTLVPIRTTTTTARHTKHWHTQTATQFTALILVWLTWLED